MVIIIFKSEIDFKFFFFFFNYVCRTLNAGELYQCEYCSYRTTLSSAFTQHSFTCLSVPEEGRRYRCFICRLTFTSKEQVIPSIVVLLIDLSVLWSLIISIERHVLQVLVGFFLFWNVKKKNTCFLHWNCSENQWNTVLILKHFNHSFKCLKNNGI